MNKTIDIVIADDHPLMLQGLKNFLESRKYAVVFSGKNGIETYSAIVKYKPEIAILDIGMPGMNGIEIAKKLLEAAIKTKIIFLTMYKSEEMLLSAQKYHVKGYLLKELALEEIEECIQQVVHGNSFYSPKLINNLRQSIFTEALNPLLKELTPSEIKILKLISEEKNTHDIADALFISVKTVEYHRSNLIKKLNLPLAKNSLLLWAVKNKELIGEQL
jgi:DNA-binding NarL/FixJ family response regulator